MRTLNRNKVKLWMCNKTGVTEQVDGEGFYTGVKIPTYSVPQVVYLILYPYNSSIAETIFGKDQSFDMFATSTDVILTTDSLLYLTEPTSNYGNVYDYSLDKIAHSLNVYQYALKRKI